MKPASTAGCVWIVNHYANDPSDTAGGARHFYLARRLSQLGWVPVVIGASTEHNSSKQRLATGQRVGGHETENVTFRWLRTPAYKGNGFKRIVNILAFTLALRRRRSTSDLPAPTVIIGSTVHPFAAMAARQLARRYGVPFIFEIRDLWPQTLIDMGKLRSKSVPAVVLRHIERSLCRSAAGIVTLLPRAVDYLQSIGVDRKSVAWISNGTNVDEFVPTPTNEHTTFTFQYVGSMGNANGLTAIISGFNEFMSKNDNPRCQLVLTGSGPLKPVLERLAADSPATASIKFGVVVPRSDVPRVLGAADCLVINLLGLDVYRYGVSMNKLFDYMAASKPIILAANMANDPIRKVDIGVFAGADDSHGIAEAMDAVFSADSAQRAVWGRNSRDYVTKNFDYAVLGDKLNDFLRSVLREVPHHGHLH